MVGARARARARIEAGVRVRVSVSVRVSVRVRVRVRIRVRVRVRVRDGGFGWDPGKNMKQGAIIQMILSGVCYESMLSGTSRALLDVDSSDLIGFRTASAVDSNMALRCIFDMRVSHYVGGENTNRVASIFALHSLLSADEAVN